MAAVDVDHVTKQYDTADAVTLTGTSPTVVESILQARRQVHRTNERRFTLLQLGSDVLLLVVAVQVVLAALWLIV